ncbi:lycopene cyclase (CrtL-type) [Motilibacter rhizosphaerae]|uniref:Lycopene cyclase (CrtL-type) n=1 Tax=Motilibacter rhizosphaerae TaxID=598652 RepID=A0A4Q7NAX0_9ACTN|nr:lycopene cyclase family protein [Motilibacter rhizosphaerae]RZS80098.1 lycopene cyclase (CrtL-type) [Motilibacter rhizosphaerae]
MRAWDVVVAGGGPAGTAAAAACASRGLRVLHLSDGTPWRPTYCLWWDELVEAAHGLGLPDPAALATRYAAPLVRTRARGTRVLAPAYARLDNARLQDALAPPAVTRQPGRLEGVEAEGTTAYAVVRRDGRTERVPAGTVVVATGATGRGRAQQRAWGEVVSGAEALVPPGGAVFMDWVSPRGDTPVFLYALDLGGGRALVELTSLAADPPVDLRVLAEELALLLRDAGAVRCGEPERVAIPLGPRPWSEGPGVPFGAAAGLVHPATGYSVSTALRAAPGLADAVVRALGTPLAARRAAAASRAVRSPSRRATGALLDRGLEVLLPLDRAGCDAFFAAFLDLPDPLWRAYLDPLAPPWRVVSAMGATLAALPGPLRAATLRGSLLPRTRPALPR